MALMARSSLRMRWVSFSILVLVGIIHAACQSVPTSMGQDDLKTVRFEKFEQLSFDGWISALVFTEGGHALTVGGCQALLSTAAGRGRHCSQGMVKVWSLDDVRLKTTATYPKEVTALAISPNGKQWIAGDSEGRLMRSTVDTKMIPRPMHQRGEITALTVSPDGRWAASGSLDPSYPLGFMDMRTGGVIRVNVKLEPVTSLAFSPDGKHLAVGMSRGGIVVWDFTSQSDLDRVAPNLKEKQAITSVTFSPDGRFLAYGRRDGEMVIWDRSSGKSLVKFSGSSSISGLTFSPDGQYIAIGQDNGKVFLLESNGARQVWSKRHVLPITDIAYSPDGSFLAVAVQQHVYLYYVGGGAEPSQLHRAQDGSLNRGMFMAEVPSAVASQTFVRVLEISQQEFLRLLPFDRLVESAVRAMAANVSGASVDPLESSRAYALVIRANSRVLSVDLARLHWAEGGMGLREAVRTFEAAQRFLLAAAPGMAVRLEDVAVKAVIAELGPSMRLVRLSGESATSSVGKGVQTAEDQVTRLLEENRVPYLKVAQFTASTTRQAEAWLRRVAASRYSAGAPILDLRDNSGGELDSAMQTASLLLPKDQLVAGLILRKTGDRVEYRSRGMAHSQGPFQGPFVVLVNERTAGTAEMLACAMHTAEVGILVGAQTAGVDEVYQTFALPGGGGLRVSAARFDCPDGRSLRWKGQAADLSIDRVPGIEVVPVGGTSTWSVSGGHRPVRMPVGLRETSDRDLILGIQAALCLSSAHGKGGAPSRDRAMVKLKRHLSSCGMFPS